MLTVAMLFGDNMVLQRQKEIKIWGTGDTGKTIKGLLKGEEYTEAITDVDNAGNWMLVFPPQEAKRGVEAIITDGSDTVRFENVCIGEVWLAGGQSNMEYHLEFDEEKENVLAGFMNPDIRFFDYPEVSYEEQIKEGDYSKFGFWRTCTRENLPYFSAAGYYFAENLNENLDIPIGILGCNWGGTPACAWMDPSYLKDNEGKAWLDEYDEEVKGLDVKAYQSSFKANPTNYHTDFFGDPMTCKILYPGISREEQLEWMRQMPEAEEDLSHRMGPYHECRPGGLYETMVRKAAPYTLRGVIWYQGEADDRRAELYGIVFSQMIQNWRDLWQDELPFLFVQLAPFGRWMAASGKPFPKLRNQQEWVSKNITNTWMISSSDAGMEWDVHPKHKRPIGTRLALLARGHVYGEDLLCDPPELKSARRTEAGIQVEFNYSEGLHIEGSHVNGLVLIDERGAIIMPDRMIIKEDKLLISGRFPEKITVSFAKTPYYQVNLYNKMNNPVKPFEITI